jgi:hypothetical protein
MRTLGYALCGFPDGAEPNVLRPTSKLSSHRLGGFLSAMATCEQPKLRRLRVTSSDIGRAPTSE